MLLFVVYILSLVTSVSTIPDFNPCNNYTVLDEPWRATNYTADLNHCDSLVSWHGWYRLMYYGQNIQLPEQCLHSSGCGTGGKLWMNGTHPQIQDGIVMREMCKALTRGDCCYDKAPPIKVKACPGNFFVYQFVSPNGCNFAYCADINTISKTSTLTPATVPSSTASTDPCGELHCTEAEVCGESYGIYGCLCNKSVCDENNVQSNPQTFGLVVECHNSSGWVSLSRCLLSEAGFPADVLHLNNPECAGTVRDGRVQFHFNNDDEKCGTLLKANETHFIYENAILGKVDSAEGHLISRQRQLNLQFVCEYPLTHATSMDMAVHTLKSVIRPNLPGEQGTYQVQLTPYQDAGFTELFSDFVAEKSDEKIYIAVDVDGVDGRQFSSVLDSCWATPVNDSTSSTRWDLITNQCPNPEDETVEVLRNGVTTGSRFSFRMFTFSGFSSQVYLHCSLHLCPLEDNSCTPNCNNLHQRARKSTDMPDKITISYGPLSFPENTDVLAVQVPQTKRRSNKHHTSLFSS